MTTKKESGSSPARSAITPLKGSVVRTLLMGCPVLLWLDLNTASIKVRGILAQINF